MGTWGTAIFSDDLTADIKREYQTLLAFGVPQEEALKKTIEYFNAGTDRDDCRFWFAIASIQIRYSCLEKEVAGIALKLLEQGGDIDKWEEEDRSKRLNVLEKLKSQLISYDTSLPPRKLPKPRVYKAKWKLGDVLSYRLINSPYAPFYNMYTGLQVVNIKRTPVSHICPELVCDEWMDIAMFDYIEKDKPDIDILLKRGYCPIYQKTCNDEVIQRELITFSYHPYKGDPSKYDPGKTTGVLYNIELLGNQGDLNYPADKLNSNAGMYDEIEVLLGRWQKFKGRFRQP